MKRFLTTFYASFLLAVLPFIAFTSCSDDDLSVPPIGGGDGSIAVVKFILNGSAPGSENAPSTYALGKTEEETVSEVDILLFSINNSLDNALPIVGTVKTDGSGGIHVEANIPVKYYGSIVLLANARSILSPITLTEGMQYTAVMPLLELKLGDKWNATEGSPGYMPIPMHGETGFVKIDADVTNTFNTGLTRMLNRVDVALTTDVAKGAFELTSVAVYYRNTVGRVLRPQIAGAPNLPEETKKIKGPLRYTDTDNEITNKISLVGEIYLMESHIVVDKTDGLKRVDEATCLVVGGKYVPDGKTYYYRIDFALKDSDPAGFPLHYYNILRNYHYNVNITAVNGPGEGSEEEALDTERSLIDVEVIPWDNGGAIDGAIDGQHILRLSQGSFDLSSDAQTATSTLNKLTVSSTHPDGWYIEKITEEIAGTETAIPEVDGWLQTDLNPVNSPYTTEIFSLILTENSFTPPQPRIGYIYIKSGPRMVFRLKVTQVKGLIKIARVDWVDYLGDDFKTITIENTLGESFTSAVATDGKLSSLIKTEDIAVIKVTYIGNEITVPLAKHSYDAKLKTLTLFDGRLIGLPIHLDKMRNELDEHYIQVADVNLAGYKNFEELTGNWQPVGTDGMPFTGSYDGGSGNGGKGFKIYSLYIDRPNNDYIGLFGDVSGSLKNIHIASGNITGKNLVGGISGRTSDATSLVTGCTNAANISGYSSVGGIIGYARGNISNCENTVAITGVGVGAQNIGGICGNTFRIIIKECTNTGTIIANATENKNIGGICGQSNYSEILNSTNTGKVSGAANVGGICGYMYTITDIKGSISNCNNSNVITGTGNYTGGICGYNSGPEGTIMHSTNSGEVKGESYIGGICGYTLGPISNCTNTGHLTGIKLLNNEYNTYIGGICGYNNGNSIKDCTNEGDISAPFESSKNLGGIVGLNKGIVGENKGVIEKCINSGSVNGGSSLGGIAGYNTESATINKCENSGAITSEQTGVSNIGGICGYNTSSTISFCSNTGEINGHSQLGGISGSHANAGIITGCRNGAKITGLGSLIGGICGYSDIAGTIIENCENLLGANVSGVSQVGGIVGQNSVLGDLVVVKACINVATITGTDKVGGICGASKSSLYACYNIGLVTGTTNVGPIWGYRGLNTVDPPPPTLKSCYYGGAATSTGLISGAILFGDSSWPSSGMTGWETPSPWSELGGWNLGDPTYPKLNIPVVTPAPYRRR